MRKELPKVYDPREVEPQIYQMWMDNGCFKADPDPKKKPFSIVMPCGFPAPTTPVSPPRSRWRSDCGRRST